MIFALAIKSKQMNRTMWNIDVCAALLTTNPWPGTIALNNELEARAQELIQTC